MNRPSPRFLDAIVTTWDTVSKASIPPSNPSSAAVQSVIKRSDDDSKLSIDIQTPQYTATIAAWEQAYCLDITLIEHATGSGVELSAGECTSQEQMQERITLLCEMLMPK